MKYFDYSMTPALIAGVLNKGLSQKFPNINRNVIDVS